MQALDDKNSLLIYRVGPVYCCVPSFPVLSIIQPPALTRPPGSTDAQPGIIKVAQLIVQVVDLRYRFGVQPQDWAKPGRLIVAKLQAGNFGFWVDEVIDVTQYPIQGWARVPPHIPAEPFVKTLLHKDRIHLYSDLEKLNTLQQVGYLKEYIQVLQQQTAQKQVSQQQKLTKTGNSNLTFKNSSRETSVADQQEILPCVSTHRDGEREVILKGIAVESAGGEPYKKKRSSGVVEDSAKSSLTAVPPSGDSSLLSHRGSNLVRKNKDSKTYESLSVSGKNQKIQTSSENFDKHSVVGMGDNVRSSNLVSRQNKQLDSFEVGHTKQNSLYVKEQKITSGGVEALDEKVTLPASLDKRHQHTNLDNVLVKGAGKYDVRAKMPSTTPAEQQLLHNSKLEQYDRVSSSRYSVVIFFAIMFLLLAMMSAYWMWDSDFRGVENKTVKAKGVVNELPKYPRVSKANATTKAHIPDVGHDSITVAKVGERSELTSVEESSDLADSQQVIHKESLVHHPKENTASTVNEYSQHQSPATNNSSFHADIVEEQDGITIILRSPAVSDELQLANDKLKELPQIGNGSIVTQSKMDETEEVAQQASAELTNVNQQSPEQLASIKSTEDMQTIYIGERQHAQPILVSEYIHIVVKGDTLWHIAKRYVKNPFLYPELARLSNIRNPHLIYPGNRVHIIHYHR